MEEENQVLEELHSVLSKTRKRITNSILQAESDKIKQEADALMEAESTGVSFDNLNTIKGENDEDEDDDKRTLTLDTISEFCRNIGTENAEKAENDEEIEFKPKKRKEEEVDKSDESSEDLSDMEVASEDHSKSKIDEDEDNGILNDEPIIDRGIASALKLAVNKGYLGKEKDKQNARLGKSSIQAENFTVEERNFYDIDDKYNRNRDKFSGPLSEFDEKRNYKPDIKLDYFDEKGHAMNEKEAFRYLSHRFHGKGPGKKKTEKRLTKTKESEAMNRMSSVDTPLNTVALLVEKQKNFNSLMWCLVLKKESKISMKNIFYDLTFI